MPALGPWPLVIVEFMPPAAMANGFEFFGETVEMPHDVPCKVVVKYLFNFILISF